MGLGRSGKILYVYASVCIKERICLYRVALRTEVMQCGVATIGKPRANRSRPVASAIKRFTGCAAKNGCLVLQTVPILNFRRKSACDRNRSL
jgi:hypothetical protein